MSGTVATGIFTAEIWRGLKTRESGKYTEHFRKLNAVTKSTTEYSIYDIPVLNAQLHWEITA